MIRSVMLIWKGGRWEITNIRTETALDSDVPKEFFSGDASLLSESPRYRFVLAGRCAQYHLYQQAD